MASRQSNKVELGSKAIGFELFEPHTGNIVSFDMNNYSKATLIVFMCNHCPYVIHIASALSSLTSTYIPKGLNVFAINPNDPKQYPEDSPEKMKSFVEKYNIPFHYLFDESQEVARKYDAQCTPEFFLYDSNLILQYHGQFDGARPGNGINVTGEDLRAAIDAVLLGQLPTREQKSCVGCSIKWK